jgi:hypothetical protein
MDLPHEELLFPTAMDGFEAMSNIDAGNLGRSAQGSVGLIMFVGIMVCWKNGVQLPGL